jgi:HlyD family secretion protein
MGKWIRRLVWLGIAGLVVGLIVWAMLPQPVPVDLATVQPGALLVTVAAEGKTRVRERYIVSLPLAGQVMRIDLKPGDPVEAGKTQLALVEPADPALLDERSRKQAEARVKGAEAAQQQAQAQLARAKVALENARAEFARAQRLLESRSIAPEELESKEIRQRIAAEELRAAEFAVRIADFEVEQARAALVQSTPSADADVRRFRILSPITGQVLRVFQESSAVLTPGTRLLELGDPAQLECEINVLSTDAVKIRPGAKVSLEHWGGPTPLQGRVRVVEPAAYTKISALGVEEQRVNIIVDFIDPPERRAALGDGYRVEARIIVAEAEHVLKVPTAALFRDQNSWAVYVVQGDRAVLRLVKLGLNNGLEAEVLDGLKEGERVVLHPGDKVHAGTQVIERTTGTSK